MNFKFVHFKLYQALFTTLRLLILYFLCILLPINLTRISSPTILHCQLHLKPVSTTDMLVLQFQNGRMLTITPWTHSNMELDITLSSLGLSYIPVFYIITLFTYSIAFLKGLHCTVCEQVNNFVHLNTPNFQVEQFYERQFLYAPAFTSLFHFISI